MQCYSFNDMKKLTIQDLVPQKANFKLKDIDHELTLKPWSLRVKTWAVEKYGAGELKKIMEKMQTIQIGEITFFMLTDECKALFKNDINNYLDAVQGVQDELAMHKALLHSMGLGEPEIEALANTTIEAAELPDPKTLAASDKSEP